MDTSTNATSGAELRDYLAQERTFLAWIRTGIALMGFGFVLSHFGFVRDTEVTQHVASIQADQMSLWLGVALIAVGVAVNLVSACQYMRLVGALKDGRVVRRSVSKQGMAVAMFLALLGIGATLYMLVALGPVLRTQLAYPQASMGDNYGGFKGAVLRL